MVRRRLSPQAYGRDVQLNTILSKTRHADYKFGVKNPFLILLLQEMKTCHDL